MNPQDLSSNEPSGSTSPTVKRRRFYNACDTCKQKKLRCDSCDSPNNICSNCIASGLECTHEVVKKKSRNQGLTEKSISSRIDDILCVPGSYIPPREPSIARKLITELASHARSLEIRLARLESGNTSSSEPGPSSTDHDDEQPDTLLESFQNLSIYPSNRRFYGRSSGAMLLQTAWESKKEAHIDSEVLDKEFGDYDWQRTEYWSVHPGGLFQSNACADLQFPEHDLILHLSDIYFRYNALTASFIHRPTFERSVHQGLYLHDRLFGYLMLSVCACASRYSTDPRVLAELEDPQNKQSRQVGWKWYFQLQTITMTLAEPRTLSAYELQTLCNCIWFLQPEPTSASVITWLLVGKGIRMAQEIGIHRLQWYIDNSETRSPVELEEWKRSFWFLVTTDILISGFLGRPRATSPDDYDLDYPVDCDDEYWENPDPEQAFRQPSDKPSGMTFWSSLLRLLQVYSYAQRTIYAVKRPELLSNPSSTWRKDALTKIELQLREWEKSVVDHLKWDPLNVPKEPKFLHQSATLYSFYYCIQIQVYRYFMPGPSSKPSDSPSNSFLDICVDTARSCIQMLDISSRGNKFTPVPPVLHSILSSAMILLVKIWRSVKFAPETNLLPELSSVYMCIEILQRLEQRTQVAGRLRDILEALISTHTPPTNLGDSSSSTDPTAAASSSTAILIPEFVILNLQGHSSSSNSSSNVQLQAAPVSLLGEVPSIPGPLARASDSFDADMLAVHEAPMDTDSDAMVSPDRSSQAQAGFEAMLVDFLFAPPTMQDTWNSFSSRYDQSRDPE